MTQNKSIENKIDWMFERDLSTLSCHAAIEIDSLITDEYRGLDSVQELSDMLSQKVIPLEQNMDSFLLLDTTAMAVMRYAIDENRSYEALTSMEDFTISAKSILQKLISTKDKYEQNQERDTEELTELREFCLALSKQASNYQLPLYDVNSKHPYKC